MFRRVSIEVEKDYEVQEAQEEEKTVSPGKSLIDPADAKKALIETEIIQTNKAIIDEDQTDEGRGTGNNSTNQKTKKSFMPNPMGLSSGIPL